MPAKLAMGLIGSQWYSDRWSPQFVNFKIMILEIIPVIMCISLFASHFKNKGLILHIDNLALVYAIDKTSKCPTVMSLIRRLVVHKLIHDISLHAVHISSQKNIVADLNSCCRVEQARIVATFLEEDPVILPKEPLPNSILQDV